MNAIQAFVPLDVVKTFAAFLEFCYIARRNVITSDSLEQLNVALHKFHESRQVFSGTVREDGPSGFSLPRQHSMVHYYEHIKDFGSPNGLCSSITESKHIAAVKRPWRRSNKHMALPQMLKVNERLDKLAAARADFTARGMMADSCLVHAIMECNATGKEDPMDEDASDSSETDSDASGEIYPFSMNNTGTPDPTNAGTPDDTNTNTCTPDDTNTLDNVDSLEGTDALDNADTLSSNNHLPAPPNDAEDDDHGPVESGPLMNEVRFVGRKG